MVIRHRVRAILGAVEVHNNQVKPSIKARCIPESIATISQSLPRIRLPAMWGLGDYYIEAGGLVACME